MNFRCKLGLHKWHRQLWLDEPEYKAGLECSICGKKIRWKVSRTSRLLLLLFVGLLIIGCGTPAANSSPKPIYKTTDSPFIFTYHDDEHQVTCWVWNQGGISCLPDSSIK